ncbi:MAG: hypothetical protein ABI808_05495 [Pseudonocardiales bacterium]
MALVKPADVKDGQAERNLVAPALAGIGELPLQRSEQAEDAACATAVPVRTSTPAEELDRLEPPGGRGEIVALPSAEAGPLATYIQAAW